MLTKLPHAVPGAMDVAIAGDDSEAWKSCSLNPLLNSCIFNQQHLIAVPENRNVVKLITSDGDPQPSKEVKGPIHQV